jgi:uncharacterized protein YbjT (DUF2867 family)
MNILICGANGFVGRALCTRLEREGHRVVRGVRHAAANEIRIDYTSDLHADQWLTRLRGVDAVINAVGILTERGSLTFDAIHRDAPIALFEACRLTGIKRVLQISALGSEDGDTGYFRSKREADAFLMTLPIGFDVVRPALVYGASGTSARLFRTLASLPVHVLPGDGHQVFRPVHIDDLTEVVACLVRKPSSDLRCIDVVGATQVDYRTMLATYRAAMNLPPAMSIRIPAVLIRAAAAIGTGLPGSMLTRDTWTMLNRGNTASDATTASLLQRPPLGIGQFIGADATARRHEALASWRPAVFRGALSVVWIWTALVSAFIYPKAVSLALLDCVHLHGLLAIAVLYLASALDLGMGIATLAWPSRRLWAMQVLVVASYTIIVAATLPAALLDPFGPILKNLPIIALLISLHSEELQS